VAWIDNDARRPRRSTFQFQPGRRLPAFIRLSRQLRPMTIATPSGPRTVRTQLGSFRDAAALLMLSAAFVGLVAIGLILFRDRYVLNEKIPLTTRAIEALRRPLETRYIPAAADAPAQYVRLIRAAKPAPLIIELPSWSGGYGGLSGRDQPLVSAVRDLGWNFLRPNLMGANNHPGACCSEKVIASLKTAIDFARREANILDGEIYLVGESGGGYATLCAMLSGAFAAKAYFAWVPVTDLVAWHSQIQSSARARTIRQCTGNAARLDEAEARRRSPLYRAIPESAGSRSLKIYVGVHDGWRGTVPITHGIRMFNRFADAARPASRVSDAELLTLLEGRKLDDDGSQTIAGRSVRLRRSAAGAELIVFEGQHEMLTRQVIDDVRAVMGVSRPDRQAGGTE
jgi:hypothetical protein